MKLQRTVVRIFITAILVFLSVAFPLPAKADGGPVVGPYLWAMLKEGQQVAVITMLDTENAKVDLFISIADTSGESHEVVFFVPLGMEATDFGVRERNSLKFDLANTAKLDDYIQMEANRKQGVIRSLFGASLLTNGVWLLPFWIPVILSGCAGPPPEATYETDSSQVSIYGLDGNTDIEGLISTTGLDPSVRDTLNRLRGQRIAIVTLQTQPQGGEGGPDEPYEPGEPGIQLSWRTSLINGDSGASYAYPLGTGDAWYHPIEITRVYVYAPPGIDFSVKYPELGVEHSGYSQKYQGGWQRINDYRDIPAYAVEEAAGDFGRVWRIIYSQSNAAEDIIITAKPQSDLSRMMIGWQAAGNSGVAFLVGFILALSLWILGWRFLAPRVMRSIDRQQSNKLWIYALIYTGINIILMVPGIILYFFWSWTGEPLTFVFLLLLFGGVSVLVFILTRVKRLGVSLRQAVRAYILVTLASNGIYLIIALAYAKLTSVI